MDNLSFSGSNDTGRSASIHQPSERPTSHDSRQSGSTNVSDQHPCDISVRSTSASSSTTFSAAQVDDRSSVASRAANSSAFSAWQPNDGSFITSRTASTLSPVSATQVNDESSVVSLGATSSTLLTRSPNDGSSIASRTSAASSPVLVIQVNSINSSASPITNFISSTESQYNGAEILDGLPTNASNMSRGRARDSNNSRSNASANHSLESVSLNGHSIDAANRNKDTQRQGHHHRKLAVGDNPESRADSRDQSRTSVMVDIVSDELSDDDDSGSRNSIASASEHAQATDEGNVDALSTTDGGLILQLILCCKTIEVQYVVIHYRSTHASK